MKFAWSWEGFPSRLLRGEFRGVVEDLAGGVAEAVGVWDGHPGVFLLELHLGEDGFLGFLKQAVDPAENEHGQDDIAVFPADENVAEAIVRDGPDEGDDAVVGGVIH